MFKDYLNKLLKGVDLTWAESRRVMEEIMEGRSSESQMAAVLIALRMKGESVEEIGAFAEVMREKATHIPVEHDCIIDTCGTGGDGSGSFNISTTVAFLLAGGGYRVAKHGNRSMTSKSGSADLLEALGVNINLTPVQVARCINETGIGFLFAPALHSAMKAVMPVRKDLAVRTIFNLLGPLTNPAGATIQIIGLYDSVLVNKIIRVLKSLGSVSAFTFSGVSGLDEVCIAGDTKVSRLARDGSMTDFIFNPSAYGYQTADLADIRGGYPAENAQTTIDILSGALKGPKRDIVALNAGFAIAAVDDCSLAEGFERAEKLLNEGVGVMAVDQLQAITNAF